MLQHECNLKHVSTLYFILFNFVNYLIILQKFKLSKKLNQI